MAKTKEYIQNRYSIIIRLILEGRIECLPVYSRSALPGEDPTVVLNFKSVRHRMPYRIAPRRQRRRDGTLAKRRRRKDNRSTLSIGPWISVYVPIGKNSPLQEVLARGDPAELRDNFIEIKNGVAKVKVFALIKDLSAAARQTDHIFARLSEELSELTDRRIELESEFRNVGFSSLDPGQQLSIRAELAAINLGVSKIQRIGADRAARDFALHFVIRETFLRLQQYSEGLKNLARSISRRRRGFDRSHLLAYLNGLDRDLAFFASKEILPFRGNARREIRKITGDEEQELTPGLIVVSLFRASQSLTKAANRLATWDEPLDEEEIKKSRSMRHLVAAHQQL